MRFLKIFGTKFSIRHVMMQKYLPLKFYKLVCFASLTLGLFLGIAANGGSDQARIAFEAESKSAIQSLEQIELSFIADPHGELLPLPGARQVLEPILAYLNSSEIIQQTQQSETVRLLREHLITSLIHLNLKPEVINDNKPDYKFIDNSYPYETVFEKPFPKRPTLEFLENFVRFLETTGQINTRTGVDIKNLISSFPAFGSMAEEIAARVAPSLGKSQNPLELSQEEVLLRPVDSYLILRSRIGTFGEIASIPEFAPAVDGALKVLRSDTDIRTLISKDPVFNAEVISAIKELETVKLGAGKATLTQPEFHEPFPYRRTILAIERAVAVADLSERLKYSVSEDWYEVEDSWHPKKSGYKGPPKLMSLYHFNRYKYQQFGLLANPNVVIFPWSRTLSEEDLIRNRVVPLALTGTFFKTQRADRHHNTPLDFWYHDINHIRRMWGYDKKYAQTNGIRTWKGLIGDFRNRESFLEDLLTKTDPETKDPNVNDQEKKLRRMERDLMFETFHETALPAARSSLLNDIFRYKAVNQPFERLVQKETQTEFVRTFDGNVQSGANGLYSSFSLSEPIVVRYYWDRAPNYIANVDNKARWGFHGSVYSQRDDAYFTQFFNPENLAKATLTLLQKIGFSEGENGQLSPSRTQLIRAAKQRNGQRELWNYWALNPNDDISQEGKEILARPPAPKMTSDDQKASTDFQAKHPNSSAEDIAANTPIDQDKIELIRWMKEDLENYLKNFEAIFKGKLSRILQHQKQRHEDMQRWLAPLERKLLHTPDDQELKNEIERLKNELKPQAFVQTYSSSADFESKFIGASGKVSKTALTPEEKKSMNKSGKSLLYIDSWSVPFFNSATQTLDLARSGLAGALEKFRKIDLDGPISMKDFTELVAIHARPEFDDVRRYKLKLFPSIIERNKFSSERSDALIVGRKFPNEQLLFTNKNLEMDPLSYTFGQKKHFVQLVSHSETELKADGRIFTGPADFLEHDLFHAFFNLSDTLPGSPEEWRAVHDEFLLRVNKEPNSGKRKMMSIIYFHLTHESGFRALLPVYGTNKIDPKAYQNLLANIREKIRIRNYYDWIPHLKEFKGDHEKYLGPVFRDVSSFFKKHFLAIQKRQRAVEGQKRTSGSNSCKKFYGNQL